VLLVEPAAGNAVDDNINPVSRLYHAASTAVFTPYSLSQDVGLALGAQAGERGLSEVMHEAGFSTVRRAAATPFQFRPRGKTDLARLVWHIPSNGGGFFCLKLKQSLYLAILAEKEFVLWISGLEAFWKVPRRREAPWRSSTCFVPSRPRLWSSLMALCASLWSTLSRTL
jgi:hypothetical protein